MGSTPDPGHSQLTQHSFTQQAPTFEDQRFNRVLTTESEWLYASLARRSTDLVLDVAAGTGLAGRSLARDVKAVIAVDATPGMLEVGRQRAADEGLENIVFQRGDAAALPFTDDAFDIVVCRYALHHFPHPDAQLAEMVRVLKPAGQLALADLVSSEDPATAAAHNELETLRDQSHARALSRSELEAALRRQGLVLIADETREIRRPLAPWVQQTQTPPAATLKIQQALIGELDHGATATGLQPQRDEHGELTIVQTLTSLIARPV